MLNRKNVAFFLFFMTSFVYGKTMSKYKLPEEQVYAENYKTFSINKKDSVETVIEKELFGKLTFDSVWGLVSPKGGSYFHYHFYKVGEDNICLAIETSNGFQDNLGIFVNTEKQCGTKCNVYLDKPEEKQIFYLWEPSKEIITDNQKEKLIIKTSKKTYTVYLRKGIKELELTGDSKIKSIKGLEKFPYLINLTFIGFDY